MRARHLLTIEGCPCAMSRGLKGSLGLLAPLRATAGPHH